MEQYGIFNVKFSDLTHDKIQNSTVLMPFWEKIFGYGTIVFATSSLVGGINPSQSAKMMSVGGAIVWKAVEQPDILHRHVQEIIRASLETMKMEEYKKMAKMFQVAGSSPVPANSQSAEEIQTPQYPPQSQSGSMQPSLPQPSVPVYQRTVRCKRCGYVYVVNVPPGQATQCPRCGFINY